MAVWIIMECQNRLCESRFSPVRERPKLRSGRWPVRQSEWRDKNDTNHLCPSCGVAGKIIRKVHESRKSRAAIR